ncbi:MAG TPA: GTPase, partial [Thermoanaerobaculia bacterium]
TLFNAVVGAERAIVTEIPGTTRDALEASIDVAGIPVTLVDTAGLRESGDLVERIGVARAREEAHRADAIVYVFDASAGFSREDAQALAGLPRTPRLLIANKADRLAGGPVPEGATALCGLSPQAGASLSRLLAEKIAVNVRTHESSELLGSLRQRDLVERARRAAQEALDSLAREDSPEYAAAHCHAALDALADLTGETTADDVLARLFSTFCVGK